MMLSFQAVPVWGRLRDQRRCNGTEHPLRIIRRQTYLQTALAAIHQDQIVRQGLHLDDRG